MYKIPELSLEIVPVLIAPGMEKPCFLLAHEISDSAEYFL